ncbi:hypothetical protein [Bartonella sp. A05]|uniref:hypothetical protein n=1 Tax=Bartonella sp. A05 TaxID=2967261 RepID=UPI0022A93C6C|nr:hypothetical protein [Bartonella sp. A05]MCZ2204271.1 hypothetical protein [Bartonella sp. A05]
MRLKRNFISIPFFIMIVYLSSIIMALSNELVDNPYPYCQTLEHIFIQKNITKAGQNSFTASQIKKRIMKNGLDIKQLRLDDKGIWRALVEFNKCHFLISVDYSGIISISNERK